MLNFFSKLFSIYQPLAERNHHLKYKIDLICSVFLFAGVLAFCLAIYRLPSNPHMSALDFLFSAISAWLLYYLKRHNEKIELISNVILVLTYAIFTAAYMLTPDNAMRMALYFPLVATAFFLKGKKAGFYWLLLILFTIVVVHSLPGFSSAYSDQAVVAACLYLIALFFVMWNYESVRANQDRREQEQQLQSQIDERWRLALEGVGDAVWDLEIPENKLNYSNGYVAMLGYAKEESGHHLDWLAALMHPDDRELVRLRQQAYLSGDFSGQFVTEQRLRCRDGSYKWIFCRGRVVERDAAGRPKRMLGTHTDITERKQIQEELLRSRHLLAEERELFQSILDNAPLGIWMVDVAGKPKFVNQGFCRATGITEAKFLASVHYADLLPAAVSVNCIQSDQQCLAQVKSHVSTEWIPFADGRDHLLEITKVRLLSQDGSVRGLIGLANDVTERREHEQQLEQLAHYDALTGVPNRVLLADRLAQALARAKREKELLAVCYLDLDGFKPVNDNFGHEAGDQVLVEITRRIKEVIREDDTVARLGGDEFVVLLVGMAATQECVGSLNRLLAKIHQPIAIQNQFVSVSASIGVALYPEDDDNADTLLRHADQAMYVAKLSGKNRYHLFDAAQDQSARSHHEVLKQIRQGLQQGEFELYYQPKLALATHRLVGAEALIRWNHPQRGLLLPGDFLRMIENTALEIVLGEWVIERALAQMQQWQQQGITLNVSVNISAYQLQMPDFVTRLQQQVLHFCAAEETCGLQIEVLETTALEDIAGISAIINACRAFGVGFALDDFGTGYSSLTYLSRLEVETLKIDQSFVRDMLSEKGDHAIVLGIIALAHAFDRSIVAEGVESEAHYQALLAIGCEVGQGHFIGHPMPAEEFMRWRQTTLL